MTVGSRGLGNSHSRGRFGDGALRPLVASWVSRSFLAIRGAVPGTGLALGMASRVGLARAGGAAAARRWASGDLGGL